MAHRNGGEGMNDELSAALADNLMWAKKAFGNSADFYTKQLTVCGISCCLMMFDGLCSLEKTWEVLLRQLANEPDFYSGGQLLRHIMEKSAIPVEPDTVSRKQQAAERLTSGFALLCIDGCPQAITVSVQSMQFRAVQEPSAEGEIRGSREGFTDMLRVNLSLLRRMIRTESLVMEVQTSHTLTRTEYAVCYSAAQADPALVRKIKQKLQAAPLPFLFDSSYFVPFLRDRWQGIFQPVSSTERPIVAAARICEGKIVILAAGSPFALIYPGYFAENFESTDDYAFPAYFAAISRLLRYAAFVLAVFLPGVYVMAVRFTPEIMPPMLLKSVLKGVDQTPLSALGEMLLVLLLLEIVRIAGMKMPKNTSGSVSLVAAIVIGSAGVEAGLLSSPLLLCAAAAAVALYTLPKLYEQIVLLRFVLLLLCGIFGPIGLAMGTMWIVMSVSCADGAGLPYLFPLYPLQRASLRDGFVRLPWPDLARRPFTVTHPAGEKQK